MILTKSYQQSTGELTASTSTMKSLFTSDIDFAAHLEVKFYSQMIPSTLPPSVIWGKHDGPDLLTEHFQRHRTCIYRRPRPIIFPAAVSALQRKRPGSLNADDKPSHHREFRVGTIFHFRIPNSAALLAELMSWFCSICKRRKWHHEKDR